MAAKSKNMNDVYYWIKDTVLTSLTNLEQAHSAGRLINNFYYQYKHKTKCNELWSNLNRELMYIKDEFFQCKLNNFVTKNVNKILLDKNNE